MIEKRNETIPMSEVDADEKFNCRGTISTIDVMELAASIKDKGLIQPITVTEYPPEKKKGKKYRLICGFRRYTAHVVNQADAIDAIIIPWMSEDEAAIFNLSENLSRQDLTIIQEAKALEKLYNLGIGRNQTAERLGKTPGWVQMRFRLLDLPPEIQNEVAAGVLKQADIRELHSILKATGNKAKVMQAANIIKDAKERGVKANVRLKDKKTKKIRMKVEINEMLDHMYASLGPCIGTRALAWAGGEIDDGELFESIKEEAEILGKFYTAPY